MSLESVPSGKFIVLEGLDGVGKSTTVALLAKRLNAVVLRTPPAVLDSLREYCAHQCLKTPQVRYHFYMLGNFMVGEEIRKHLSAGRNVVLDRFYASTMSYMWGFGHLPASSTDWPEGLVKPDHMLLLNMSRADRLHRLRKRAQASGEEMNVEEIAMNHSDEVETAVLGHYIRFGCADITINENLEPEQVVDLLMAHMQLQSPPTPPEGSTASSGV